jgi:predicted Fe-Mo cluster-binding NifX family protein
MKYRIAVGTKDDVNVTEHFGQCGRFLLIDVDQEKDEIAVAGERFTPCSSRCGEHREQQIRDKIDALGDCRIILVKQLGGWSEKQLNHRGLIGLQYQGAVDEALKRIRHAYRKHKFG